MSGCTKTLIKIKCTLREFYIVIYIIFVNKSYNNFEIEQEA